MLIGSLGGVTIEAPNSGPTLSVNVTGAGIAFNALGTATTGKIAFAGANMQLSYQNWFSAASEIAAFGQLAIGTTVASPMALLTNNAERLAITATGVVNIANLAGAGDRQVFVNSAGTLFAS
jgi:hypothetical protein